jgi:hypothetical protein
MAVLDYSNNLRFQITILTKSEAMADRVAAAKELLDELLFTTTTFGAAAVSLSRISRPAMSGIPAFRKNSGPTSLYFELGWRAPDARPSILKFVPQLLLPSSGTEEPTALRTPGIAANSASACIGICISRDLAPGSNISG